MAPVLLAAGRKTTIVRVPSGYKRVMQTRQFDFQNSPAVPDWLKRQAHG